MIGNHRIILIAAVDRNWAIGKSNKLLYHIPTDMKFFQRVTKHNIVVYGYNTFISLPAISPLANRANIILTSKELPIEFPNLCAVHSVESALSLIEDCPDDRDVFICGGESIYNQFIEYCDLAFITRINAQTKDADAHMINLDTTSGWRSVGLPLPILDEESGLTIKFYTYIRIT